MLYQMREGGQRHAPAALTWGREPIPIVHDADWAQGRCEWVYKFLPPHRDSVRRPPNS